MVFQIFLNVVAPVFLLILIGGMADRFIRLDIRTLTKLNFYITIPAILFTKIQTADLQMSSSGPVIFFMLLLTVALYGISYAAGLLIRRKEDRPVISMSSMFMNCGNMGIPLLLSAFGDQALGTVILVVVFQNVIVFSAGIRMFQKEGSKWTGIFKVPVLYFIGAGFLMRWSGLALPHFLFSPLEIISGAFIPLALFTLGAQISRTGISGKAIPLALPLLIRLVLSPVLAFFLLSLFSFSVEIKSILLVISGLPPAVNTYILAVEYKRNEKLASTIILWGTVLSAITLSVLLVLVRT